ncbi:hypothetical protein PFISCL1PPCAC_26372, partial [Pristionchus fissidentatus]
SCLLESMLTRSRGDASCMRCGLQSTRRTRLRTLTALVLRDNDREARTAEEKWNAALATTTGATNRVMRERELAEVRDELTMNFAVNASIPPTASNAQSFIAAVTAIASANGANARLPPTAIAAGSATDHALAAALGGRGESDLFAAIEADAKAQKERIAAMRENNEKSTLTYSRKCPVCLVPNPLKRRAYKCGHIVCLPCSEEQETADFVAKCPICRGISEFIPLFEDDIDNTEANQ